MFNIISCVNFTSSTRKITSYTMNKICRICLEEGVLSSIFTKNYNHILSLCDMIEYVCNTKISKDDGLPQQICSNCMYKLGIAYHFKQTCESADVRLRQYLGLQVPRKFVDASVSTDPIVPTHTTIIKKCKCKVMEKKSSTNYKKKPDDEKLKRGPKPKPKQVHSCYQCDKQFRCQAQLEMHVRTHTGDKPYKCMYCPRSFTQKHNLTIHLRIHTGEKPFQCEVCSKTFSAQGNLQAHLKIHTGQRDHVCSLCKKSFITSSELTRHMSKHRGVRNFKCDLCGCAYVHARDLKLHKQKKHQICIAKNPKVKNEGCRNNTNENIIGKEQPAMPMKDLNHLIPHLIEKTEPSVPGLPENSQPLLPGNSQPLLPENSQALLPYEQKDDKEIFNQFKVFDTQNCAICGEGFDYVTALAQHYMHSHKDHETLQPKLFGLPQ